MAFNQGCRALTPAVDTDARFFGYQLEAMTDRLRSYGYGTTFLELSSDSLAAFPVTVCPVEEQRRIADFLDTETTQISRAARLQERLVNLLTERASAYIESTIASAAASRIRLKFLLSEPLSYGANAAAEHENRDWPRYIRTTDITEDGTLRDETFKTLPPDQAAPYMLADGDILLVRSGATVGKSFHYRETYGPAAHAGYLIRARPDRRRIVPELLWQFCQTQDYWQQVVGGSVRATIQNVNAEKYGDVEVPWMELSNQRDAARDISDRMDAVRRLKELAYQQLALLIERRQALITAAVTGQLDVSTASGRGVTD